MEISVPLRKLKLVKRLKSLKRPILAISMTSSQSRKHLSPQPKKPKQTTLVISVPLRRLKLTRKLKSPKRMISAALSMTNSRSIKHLRPRGSVTLKISLRLTTSKLMTLVTSVLSINQMPMLKNLKKTLSGTSTNLFRHKKKKLRQAKSQSLLKNPRKPRKQIILGISALLTSSLRLMKNHKRVMILGVSVMTISRHSLFKLWKPRMMLILETLGGLRKQKLIKRLKSRPKRLLIK